MSYETTLTGEIEIVPPISWHDAQDSVFLEENARGKLGRLLRFVITEEVVETAEGTLHRKSAGTLVPTHSNWGDPNTMQKHLQELVDAYPEHRFTGRIDGEGEKNVDMWRLKVVNRQVKVFRPDILWERESE